MDNNNLDNQNPQPQQPEQDNVSMLDKVIQNNPFVKLGEAKYENVQTQSVVMSTREEADAQLAAINAQNAEILRQQKLAEEAAKAKRTGAYIAVGIFFAAILIVGGWLIVNAIIASQKTVAPEELAGIEEEAKYGRVEGYKCTSEKCEKATDIDANNIIIRDGSKFYIFNKTDKKKTLTSIASKDYHAITIFKWGNDNLAILDPESGQSALYNITSNRQLTEFAYDEFYTDITADTYKDMTWVAGQYIVARNGSSQRLINVSLGTEVIRANKKVFVYDKYFFAYENDGLIHVYDSTPKQFLIVKTDEYIFVKNGYLITVKANGSINFYDATGAKPKANDFTTTINAIKAKERLNALLKDKTFFHIPENN